MKAFFRIIGRLLLGNRQKELKKRLKSAGFKINPFDFLGFNFVIGFVLSIVCFYFVFNWQNNLIYSFAGAGITGFIYYFAVNSIISMYIEQRRRFVEKVLPDALQLMAANLRSGLSIDEALIMSAREEFGFLADRIKIAGDKIATGIPFSEAFKDIGKNTDSEILDQTINLIIEGQQSGGEISSILEGTAMDIRDTAVIEKEVRSVIMVYAMFIFLAVAIIAPILYAVSTQLAGVLSELSRSISVQFLTEKSPTIQLKPAQISQDFLLLFSYVNLTITGVFGSLMISLINKGSEKYGIKYVPFVLGLSLLLFYVGRIIMNSFFGGIKVL